MHFNISAIITMDPEMIDDITEEATVINMGMKII